MFDQKALAAFVNQVEIASAEMVTEDVRDLLIQSAYDERARVLAEQQARAGMRPTDTVIVDGRRDAVIETARADSLIIIEYRYLREIVRDTLIALVQRSPQRSGRYARSFVVLVGGVEIDQIEQMDHDVPEVVIVNVQPYARRLEVGKRSDGRPFVVQVSPGIMEDTARLARRRFGNVATVRFGYINLANVATLRRAQGTGRGRRAGDAITYPAITFQAL